MTKQLESPQIGAQINIHRCALWGLKPLPILKIIFLPLNVVDFFYLYFFLKLKTHGVRIFSNQANFTCLCNFCEIWPTFKGFIYNNMALISLDFFVFVLVFFFCEKQTPDAWHILMYLHMRVPPPHAGRNGKFERQKLWNLFVWSLLLVSVLPQTSLINWWYRITK